MADRNDRNGGRGPADRTPTEARQSERGKGVIYVLAGGLVLALLVWAGAELFAPDGDDPGVNTVNEDAGQAAPEAGAPAEPSQ